MSMARSSSTRESIIPLSSIESKSHFDPDHTVLIGTIHNPNDEYNYVEARFVDPSLMYVVIRIDIDDDDAKSRRRTTSRESIVHEDTYAWVCGALDSFGTKVAEGDDPEKILEEHLQIRIMSASTPRGKDLMKVPYGSYASVVRDVCTPSVTYLEKSKREIETHDDISHLVRYFEKKGKKSVRRRVDRHS